MVPVPLGPAEIVDLMTVVCSVATKFDVIETLGAVSARIGFAKDTY
jgi:hypothetical protein